MVVYNPQYNTLNLRAIADNVMAWWASEQAAAFDWLGETGLPAIKDFNDSTAARSLPVFPAVNFISDTDGVDYTSNNDLIGGAYRMRHELMVVNSVASTAVAEAKLYIRALLSLLINCPVETLVANAGNLTPETRVDTTSVEFLEILADEEETSYLQRVVLETSVLVFASRFI